MSDQKYFKWLLGGDCSVLAILISLIFIAPFQDFVAWNKLHEKLETLTCWPVDVLKCLLHSARFAFNWVACCLVLITCCVRESLRRGGLVSDQWRRTVKVSMTSGCFVLFFVSVSIAFVPARELITQHQLALASLRVRGGKKKPHKSHRRVVDRCHEQGEDSARILTPNYSTSTVHESSRCTNEWTQCE